MGGFEDLMNQTTHRLMKRLVALLFIAVLVAGCTPVSKDDATRDRPSTGQITPVVRQEFLMGTIAKITVYDQDVTDEVFRKVFDRLAEIEAKMTINEKNRESEIIALNEAAGKAFVTLSPDTFYVLEKAVEFAKLSGGKFDVTIGPLVKLWNIGEEGERVPEPGEIEEALRRVGYQHIILDKENSRAKLELPGMAVDLGGIAKGYAADEAARILREEGVEHAIVNLGGNVITLNTKPDGSRYRIGLQEPFAPTGEYMAIVHIEDESFVSSGIYERYFEQDGKIYHHLLNPQTGYPEDNALTSVTIITGVSIDADALSTATFLMGLEKGLQFIEALPDTEAIFITKDKQVYVTSGINDQNMEIVKPEYVLHR